MPDFTLPAWLPPVLFGGAAGAILTAGITTFRNRVQPVGLARDILPVFRQHLGGAGLEATVTLGHGADAVTFRNLFIAEVELVNRGNADHAEFPVGVTLPAGDMAVHIDIASRDRHHRAAVVDAPTPQHPRADIDVMLAPFNRGDRYLLKVFVVIPDDKTSPGVPDVSSPKSVRFVESPDVREVAFGALKIVGSKAFPFSFMG